jgi:hypothetical protein
VVSNLQGKTLLALVIKPLTDFPALGFKYGAYGESVNRCSYQVVLRRVEDRTDVFS